LSLPDHYFNRPPEYAAAMKPPFFALGLCLLAIIAVRPACADILSVSTVQGQVGFFNNTGFDGNPNFGLPTTFMSPINSSATLGGDGFASTFSGARYGLKGMSAFATATSPDDAFGNQAQSTVYLDDLAPTTAIAGIASLFFHFEVDGTAKLTPTFSNDELTFGFTVQSLGPGGSLDNSCHKDIVGLAGSFDFMCTETIKITNDIYFYEFMSVFARGDWCPAGGCAGILDASSTGGLVSIEALDANGNSLGPVSLVGASGAVYGSASAIPEPSQLPVLAGAFALFVWLRRSRFLNVSSNHHRRLEEF
jgi:hypothetical protein